jgi:predicted DNA-binding protein with PD1-like motif
VSSKKLEANAVKHRVLRAQPGERRFAVVFDLDDRVLTLLEQLCEAERIAAASLSGIGGFRKATLAFYDMQSKRYEPLEVDEQVEVVSLTGNITQYSGKAKIHAHCIVGDRNGRTTGGHLLAGVVRPTLELFVDEIGVPLVREDRPDIGIPLIAL